MKHLIECKACQGSGVYVGFAERDGASVVCHSCDGTGAQLIEYTPFTERKIRQNIKTVSIASGYVIAPGIDPNQVIYQEFLSGKMPTKWEK